MVCKPDAASEGKFSREADAPEFPPQPGHGFTKDVVPFASITFDLI
jgi:hypothetical protein